MHDADGVTLATGYLPGAIGRVAEMHGVFYARDWGFGYFFEAKVATELSAFLGRLDPARDGFWTASVAGRVEGSLAIDGGGPGGGAHLRWFIVGDGLRGRGIGGRLLDGALDFCRGAGHPRVFLWTFAGLDPARRLYESRGFRLVEERRGETWGVTVTEQNFVLELG